jgi:hypothetical protein
VDDDDVEENDEFALTQMELRDKNNNDQDGASKCSILEQQQHQPPDKQSPLPPKPKQLEQLAFPVLVFLGMAGIFGFGRGRLCIPRLCIPSHPSSNILILMESFRFSQDYGQTEEKEDVEEHSPPYI